MIEVKGLYKSFEGKTVLHNIDATFENGKTSLIIGQSGSGKTVLMKCIVGLLTPEKGEVLYDGRNFLAMGKKEKKHLRREMGMIFKARRCSTPCLFWIMLCFHSTCSAPTLCANKPNGLCSASTVSTSRKLKINFPAKSVEVCRSV